MRGRKLTVYQPAVRQSTAISARFNAAGQLLRGPVHAAHPSHVAIFAGGREDGTGDGRALIQLNAR
jgi:hypothetical protein